MAKKIYISEKQFEKLQEIIREESQSNLEIPVDVSNGNVEDAIAQAKENITNVLGQSMADKTSFKLKGDAVEGKTFTKKAIEESRINRIINHGKKYTKEEFAKTVLN